MIENIVLITILTLGIYTLDLFLSIFYPVDKRIVEENYITGRKYYMIQYKSPLLRIWRTDKWPTAYETLEEAREVASFRKEKKYYKV
jgi:hypothetical protein